MLQAEGLRGMSLSLGSPKQVRDQGTAHRKGYKKGTSKLPQEVSRQPLRSLYS